MALVLLLRPISDEVGEGAKGFGRLGLVGHFLDHLSVIGGCAEQLGIEIDDDLGLELKGMPEILDRDFRAFGAPPPD